MSPIGKQRTPETISDHLPPAAHTLALVAARFSPDIKAKYAHLISIVKPAKVAFTADIRKLMVAENTLLKADRLRAKSLA